MPLPSYTLPEIVTLTSAKLVADDVLRHVSSAATPTINAATLREAGVPLLQILVAANRQAEAQGKRLVVQAPADSVLARLFSTFGIDPAACGAAAVPGSQPADSSQRT
ncbi:MAG TPA: STAS domain-containing protein [Tabrizicola sp.]|nr:STAS domain-containing protein [Tabrizicola sp.]